MSTRRALSAALHALDQSTIPYSDPMRLEEEAWLIAERAKAEREERETAGQGGTWRPLAYFDAVWPGLLVNAEDR